MLSFMACTRLSTCSALSFPCMESRTSCRKACTLCASCSPPTLELAIWIASSSCMMSALDCSCRTSSWCVSSIRRTASASAFCRRDSGTSRARRSRLCSRRSSCELSTASSASRWNSCMRCSRTCLSALPSSVRMSCSMCLSITGMSTLHPRARVNSSREACACSPTALVMASVSSLRMSAMFESTNSELAFRLTTSLSSNRTACRHWPSCSRSAFWATASWSCCLAP
mmetsp:Transcript_13663/g.30940  ORF Transcript_13663/g.30940 Transcript_13663/m.30940 type:complete len:228 (-) Transcript_13663:166-849(-)